ncbi:LicD family protein [Lacrimispora sp. NSJ-141]|uniref:LicD family protein n=1 Tax=Lientehia hominis TaxID=2897778 RepID=A0AAP2RIK4_9FIRM|nr:LicD family protein [Lientehia hominis]MCD2492275.1 LicD family protein [Lientehia hominis]
MKEIDSDLLKRMELKILYQIDVICRKYKIKYFLFGGTLIGAIRHQGFIPWDDDIDICMLRNDYERFTAVMENLVTDIYFLNVDNCEEYLHPFGKVCLKNTFVKEPGIKPIPNLGVFVDVFPFDTFPEKKVKQKILLKKMYITYKFRWVSSLERYVRTKKLLNNIPNYIGYLIANMKGPQYHARKLNHFAKEYENTESSLVFNSAGHREIMKRDIFNKTVYVSFEDEQYPIPEKYDDCLKALYGDYMKLPPESERKGGHGVEAYYYEEAEL